MPNIRNKKAVSGHYITVSQVGNTIGNHEKKKKKKRKKERKKREKRKPLGK